MTTTTALVSLALVALPCLYAAWSDLRYMRLPNALSLAMIALFLVSAPFLMDLSEMGWRLGIAFAALVITFLLNAGGVIGGGDAKFGSAAMLFVAPVTDHITLFLQVLGMMALAGVVTHRLAARVPLMQGLGWQSFSERGSFPFGLSIAPALLFYLMLIGYLGA